MPKAGKKPAVLSLPTKGKKSVVVKNVKAKVPKAFAKKKTKNKY